MWRAFLVALAAGGVLLAVAFPWAASHSDAHSLSDDPTLLSHTVSAGWGHTCGVDTDGTLACWGWNDDGQATPPAGTFSQVSAGGYHTCAVKTDGTLACWGDNGLGQATPPSGTFTQVSAGLHQHTCGVRTDGTVACWGWNDDGQATPRDGTFRQVSAGYRHSCGVRTDGTLACWGDNYPYGPPTPPDGTFSQVSASMYFTCGVRTDGTLACWGSNDSGQATPPTGTFSQVSAGYQHTCGVETDGTLACWGRNMEGQATPPTGTFSQVSGGGDHTCGVETDGTLACWGWNEYGQARPPAGTIVIVKATDPAGGTGFGFSDNIAAPSSFSLDDAGTKTFSNVFTDSYTVIEDDPQVSPGGFALSGLTCTDPDGGSSVDRGARKATIDLDAGETVTCTFTNCLDLNGDGICYDEDDSDADGLTDAAELNTYLTDPLNPDTDGDLLPDGLEVRLGLSPLNRDTDGNGIPDSFEDTDADGLTNGEEWYVVGTDPGVPDTDGDGCNDGREYAGMPGFSPLHWYDFYDVPMPVSKDPNQNGTRNKSVDMADVIAVLFYTGTSSGGRLNGNGVAYDSVKGSCDWNGDTVPDKEGLCYDRTPGPLPNPPLDAGPPNGAVDMSDVIVVLTQTGLQCSGPP